MAGQGGKHANSHPRDNNIEEQFPIETEVVEDTDATCAINMTRCGFAEYFRAIGAADVGALLTCGVDFATEAVLRPDWSSAAPKPSWVARADTGAQFPPQQICDLVAFAVTWTLVGSPQ